MTDHHDPGLDDELADDERAALESWQAAEPPPGFADRVTAAPATSTAAPTVRPRRRLGPILAIAAAAAAAAVVIAVAISGPGTSRGGAATGATTVADRRSIPIGNRAVVVAETGAVLAWSVDPTGAARVEHGAGSGFYRVDHGGPFVVTTPLGEVRVTGTCFRIEVIMKASKQSLIAGTVGAALAAAVIVTVYEGGVVVAGRQGSVAVAPGERATLTAEGTPTVGSAVEVAEIAPPTATATRDQLLARDELQRRRIAGLTARVSELEQQVSAGAGGDGHDSDEMGGRPWFDPSAEQLAEWAKQCKVHFDLPPIMGSEATHLGPERAVDYGVAPDEIDPVNAVLAELHRSWTDRVRAIYIDVVGEPGAELGLSAQAMIQEIQDKSPPGERSAIQARIAQERAGLVPAPADWSHAPPIERLFRGLAALGDETEKLLGAKIGPERAHALRLKEGGWASKWSMSGCRGADDEE